MILLFYIQVSINKLNDVFKNLVNKINISDELKKRLLEIKPENYIGIAPKIVEEFDPEIY